MTGPPSGPTRAERRAQQQNGDDGGGRSRRGLVIGLIVLAVLVVGAGAAFALGAFGGDDGGGGEKAAPDPSNVIDLRSGQVQVYFPGIFGGPGAQVPPELETQLMDLLREYVDNGMVAGVRSGKVNDADLAGAFDEAALARLKGDDRSVLLDEGLPKAVGKVTVQSNDPSIVYVLNNAEGQSQVATLAINISERVRSARGPYTITRIGQFEFAPDAAGAWKITGWDLDVERSGAGVPIALQTPTTAPPPTPAVAPTTTADPTTTAGSQ